MKFAHESSRAEVVLCTPSWHGPNMAVNDVRFVASSRLPTRWGLFTAYAFVDSTGKEHLVLAIGNVSCGEPIVARIHSECLTGDALFSLRCDCGFQLRTALKIIGKEKRGVLLYLRQEGRGIGLHNKIKAYDLQDKGADTVDANVHLGFEADARSYDICKPMLDHIGVCRLSLLTNNPSKVTAMRELGFEVVKRISFASPRTPHNEAYLNTKAHRMGHLIEPDAS